MKTDRFDNVIGDGSWHYPHTVYEFPEFPEISAQIEKSESTESVYVFYRNTKLHKSVCVRFSLHTCNAVEFGDVLNGVITTRDEVLYHLGLKKRVFVPDTYLSIHFRHVKMKRVSDYEMADLTIEEMYSLGVGADLTPYVGKLAKDSNILILGDKILQHERTGVNRFGQEVVFGNYKYIDL